MYCSKKKNKEKNKCIKTIFISFLYLEINEYIIALKHRIDMYDIKI